jgi:putative ABC transport system substrate-binding protein
MNTRRKLLLAMGGACIASRWAWAQAPGRSYRIGWINTADNYRDSQNVAFVKRLEELGFVEGRNLTIERRHASNRLEQLPAAAAELAKVKCDAYFGSGIEATLAALTQAGGETPIVFVAVDFDPVLTGDVASLARPGGRVTGITALQSQLPAKRLELLKEMLPGVRQVAVFANEQTTTQLTVARGTARRIGLELHVVDLKRPPFDFESGYAEAVRARAEALLILGSSLWVPARRQITELALKSRLPTVFHQAQWVEAGGLMSYGFNFPQMWRRAAEMMTSVLKGAKAGDIPMEQPATFEFAVNLKTAKALGVKVPRTILVRADRVIE